MTDSKHLYIRRASAGSGKTFTLAAHYVALLLHGEKFQSILAVTFTNKATAEMKERIVGYLFAIARHTSDPSTQGFLARVRDISAELGYDPASIASDEVCRARAEQQFTAILANYDAMHVQTIDAFLQTLLSGMVQMLNGAVGYSVELDTDRVISDAVDALLTSGVRDDKELLRRISHYMRDQMDDDKSWDIRGELIAMGRELYRENIQQMEDRLVFDPVRLARLASMPRDTTYARFVTTYADNLVLMGALRDRIQQSLDDSNSRLLATTANTLRRALDTGDAAFVLEKAGIRYRHVMLDEFQDTSSLQWENFAKLVAELLSAGGSTLIVGDIKQSIYRWRNGDWTIMRDLPTEEPFDAFYNASLPALQRNFRSEREVVRFNLDTFRFLSSQEGDEVANLYDEGYDGTNLQDYYRPGHEKGYVRVRLYPFRNKSKLSPNTRSAVRENIIRDMLSTIHSLLLQGARPKDMMILLRLNKEATEVLKVYEQMKHDPAYPEFERQQVTLLSNDCFYLRFSRTVNILVCAIRYISGRDEAAKRYIETYCPAFDLEAESNTLRTMALPDQIEAVLERAVLSNPDYVVDDLAYVNTFRDSLRRYVQSNGSDAKAFLRYWDEKLAESSIPVTERDGVTLMTIHTSKGLQAPNVFIPFADWAMEKDRSTDKLWCEVPELSTDDGRSALMPIPQKKEICEHPAFGRAYCREHQLQRIDNLNVLYVALTRAAERLYIYADVPSYKTTKTVKTRSEWNVAQLLAERLNLWQPLDTLIDAAQTGEPDDYAEYTAGEEFWPKPEKKDSKTDSPTEPFSFALAEVSDAECHSRSSRLEFRQSQDSVLYGWNIAANLDDSSDMDRRAFGTICHEILAGIMTYDSAELAKAAVRSAVSCAYEQGKIPTTALRDEALDLLLQTVSDPQMADFYTGSWSVLCEQSFLWFDDHHELREQRMDRVLWSGNHAIVIDYKFGHDEDRYDRQVRQYMSICRQMGATQVEGYLWIAPEHRLQPVTL